MRDFKIEKAHDTGNIIVSWNNEITDRVGFQSQIILQDDWQRMVSLLASPHVDLIVRQSLIRLLYDKDQLDSLEFMILKLLHKILSLTIESMPPVAPRQEELEYQSLVTQAIRLRASVGNILMLLGVGIDAE